MKRNLRVALWFLSAAMHIIPRNHLWGVALVQAHRFTRSKWWTKAPYLPLPSPSYWEFRMESIYGNSQELPSKDDLIAYLEWCLEIR